MTRPIRSDPARKAEHEHESRLGWAEKRLAAMEADLAGLQTAGHIAPRRTVPLGWRDRIRHLPVSAWWFLGGAVLIVAAIVLAIV